VAEAGSSDEPGRKPFEPAGKVPEDECWWDPPDATATDWEPPPAPELNAEARALQNILVSQFDGHHLDLPPLPGVAERVLTCLSDPKYDAAKLSEVIAEDQVIAAAVLRMANSALFAAVNKITSLQSAVTRLGSNAVRTLMLHQAFRAAAFHRMGGDSELTGLVWNRAIANAVISRTLGPFAGVNMDESFIAGLLVDIGNVIVLREVQSQQRTLGFSVDHDMFDYFCSECHQEFGELVADAWKLPSDLKTLIADHHTPPSPGDPLRELRLTIQLADMVNSMIGYGRPVNYRLLESRPVRELRLDESDAFRESLIGLPRLLELHMDTLSF
jgi:HD-like signal output (HDOD) protein